MCLKSATCLQQEDFTDRGLRSYKTLICVNIMGIFLQQPIVNHFDILNLFNFKSNDVAMGRSRCT